MKAPRRNVYVQVAAGCVLFTWTDDEPRGEDAAGSAVFARLVDAKAWAIEKAIPERNKWIEALRHARTATRYDVTGDPYPPKESS